MSKEMIHTYDHFVCFFGARNPNLASIFTLCLDFAVQKHPKLAIMPIYVSHRIMQEVVLCTIHGNFGLQEI